MVNISVKKRNSCLGHSDSIYVLEQVSDDKFVSAGADGMVILWDLRSPDEGELIARIPGSIYALKFDQDNQFLYVGQNNQGIHKIDLKVKKEVASVHLGSHQIFDIELVEDRLWVAMETGEVAILSRDLETLSRRSYSSHRARNIQVFRNQVLISFSDNIIREVDFKTLEITHELVGHKKSVFTSSFHPSGKYLASVSMDAHIKVWDANKNYILRESIPAHLLTINDMVFSPDGRYFATGSMDKSIKLWDAYNFKLRKVLDKQRHEGHTNSVNGLLWMKYENLLVSCSDDKSISVWNIHFEQ